MSAWFHRFARGCCHVFHLPARVEMFGREHIPSRGATVLAANHISHFDPPMISITVRRSIDYIASAEFFVHPLPRAIMRGMNAFPIDRTRRDLAVVKESLRRLKQGKLVAIFIEGGIRTGAASVLNGAPFNDAAIALAQAGGAPIVPCVVLGSDQLYVRRAWFRRPRVFVGFSAPLIPAPKADRAEVARELGDRMRALAAEMRARYGITDGEMPLSAQERWALAASEARA